MEEIKQILDKIDEISMGIKIVNHKVTSMQTKDENEVNKKIIAMMESYSKIFRKIDKTLRAEDEEVLKIQVTILENEIRELKDKIEKIA